MPSTWRTFLFSRDTYFLIFSIGRREKINNKTYGSSIGFQNRDPMDGEGKNEVGKRKLRESHEGGLETHVGLIEQ